MTKLLKNRNFVERGNYLSCDSALWINPDVKPFHYEAPKEIINIEIPTETVVKDNNGNSLLKRDDDSTSRFLNQLSRMIVSDDSIINMLGKKWTRQSVDRGRNNVALSYAGILCKAGVGQ